MLDYSPALQQTYDFEATGHSILRTCVWVQVYAYGPPHCTFDECTLLYVHT